MMAAMKKAFLALAFFALFQLSLAAVPADISLDLGNDTFYASPGDTFTVDFSLYNPMPSNDNVIDRIDLYLLDLKDSGFSVAGISGNGWQHENLEKFGDEHFWISNAVSQGISITLKAEKAAKTSSINGFYSFNKLSGTPFLKDHSEFRIAVNIVPQGGQKQAPAKEQLSQKEIDSNNLVLALSIAILILIAALLAAIFMLSKKRPAVKSAQQDGKAAEKDVQQAAVAEKAKPQGKKR